MKEFETKELNYTKQIGKILVTVYIFVIFIIEFIVGRIESKFTFYNNFLFFCILFLNHYFIQYKDIRDILREQRKQVLKGCNIIFSGVIPMKQLPEKAPIWIDTESFGAKCLAVLLFFIYIYLLYRLLIKMLLLMLQQLEMEQIK